MSQREREISEKIATLEKEKKILEGTRAYYEHTTTGSNATGSRVPLKGYGFVVSNCFKGLDDLREVDRTGPNW